MDKNEILEKSRKENGNGKTDELQRKRILTGQAVGMCAGVLMCAVLSITERSMYYTMITIAMMFFMFLYNAITTRKIYNIILTILFGAAFVLYITVFLSDKGVF